MPAIGAPIALLKSVGVDVEGGWMTARGKVAFKPVTRSPEPEKPLTGQSQYSTKAEGDPPTVEKRWKKPKTEPSEDATGLGPVGSSGRIIFFSKLR